MMMMMMMMMTHSSRIGLRILRFFKIQKTRYLHFYKAKEKRA